jgi:hypothetical protein
MKQYGMMKTTEFTRKQMNVIFSLAKQRILRVENWYMNHLYDLANYYNYDYNKSVESEEVSVLNILEAVFNKNYKMAQAIIDSETEKNLNLFSINVSEKFVRDLI